MPSQRYQHHKPQQKSNTHHELPKHTSRCEPLITGNEVRAHTHPRRQPRNPRCIHSYDSERPRIVAPHGARHTRKFNASWDGTTRWEVQSPHGPPCAGKVDHLAAYPSNLMQSRVSLVRTLQHRTRASTPTCNKISTVQYHLPQLDGPTTKTKVPLSIILSIQPDNYKRGTTYLTSQGTNWRRCDRPTNTALEDTTWTANSSQTTKLPDVVTSRRGQFGHTW